LLNLVIIHFTDYIQLFVKNLKEFKKQRSPQVTASCYIWLDAVYPLIDCFKPLNFNGCHWFISWRLKSVSVILSSFSSMTKGYFDTPDKTVG
jgi:hypothetical protein